MFIKDFFKSKLNIAFTVLLGVSIIALIITSFVPALMGVSSILFGVTCGFTIPVIIWVRRRQDNSKMLENVELTQSEAKHYANVERSNKWTFIVVMIMFGIFAGVLIYTGLMIYIR